MRDVNRMEDRMERSHVERWVVEDGLGIGYPHIGQVEKSRTEEGGKRKRTQWA